MSDTFTPDQRQSPTWAPSAPSADLQAPEMGVPSGMLDFVPPRREVVTIPFRLAPDSHVYRFTAPKIAVALMPVLEGHAGGEDEGLGVTASTFDWLGQGLSEDDNKRIVARLRDPQDDLDLDTLGQVVRGLMEKIGQRPTT